MNSPTVTPLSEIELGYRFDPPTSSEQPSPHSLYVWLRTTPTGRHYDPESVQCSIITSNLSVEPLSIEHPWPMAKAYQIGPGRIVITDRKHKTIETFTFGGKLQIDSDPAVTLCTFESEAPLLPLIDQEAVAARFATEVEVMLAEGRARWDVHHSADDFANQLASLSPSLLYVACLIAVEGHLRTLPSSDDTTHDVLRFITHEREQLQTAGRWPEPAPTLADLL